MWPEQINDVAKSHQLKPVIRHDFPPIKTTAIRAVLFIGDRNYCRDNYVIRIDGHNNGTAIS